MYKFYDSSKSTMTPDMLYMPKERGALSLKNDYLNLCIEGFLIKTSTFSLRCTAQGHSLPAVASVPPGVAKISWVAL